MSETILQIADFLPRKWAAKYHW